MTITMKNRRKCNPRLARFTTFWTKPAHTFRLLTFWVVLVFSTIALCSCVDLSTITQLASSSQAVGSSFKQLADDTATACTTANGYIVPGTPTNIKLNCDVYVKLEPTLLKVNNAFFGYIAALGKLAGGNTEKQAEFSTISSDLSQADPTIESAYATDAKDAGDLADTITHLILSHYQEHEVSKIVGSQNDNVQAVAKFLSIYAAGKFKEALSAQKYLEQNFLENESDQYLKLDEHKKPYSTEPLAVILMKEVVAKRGEEIDVKIAAVTSYAEAVNSIAAAHQKLYGSKNRWTVQELITDLSPEIQQLSDSTTALIKALR